MKKGCKMVKERGLDLFRAGEKYRNLVGKSAKWNKGKRVRFSEGVKRYNSWAAKVGKLM